MNNGKLRILPLGGLGEIGKNMIVYEYGDDILIVDSGIMFPENDTKGFDMAKQIRYDERLKGIPILIISK